MKLLHLTRKLLEKGPRLIFANVTERIVFDVVNGVDTITQVAKDDFHSKPANLLHGLHYSSSWTSEIKFGFSTAKILLGSQFKDYAFIDIGCGKGKVQIVWEQLLKKSRISQPVFGLDYYDALIEQAKANLRKVLGNEGRFICADASEFDYSSIGSRLIVYLYNPFDGVILDRVLNALRSCDVVIIYNNPEHADVVLNNGFRLVQEKKGFHPQAWTVVYERRRLDASTSRSASS